jgi:hypothetical protein
MFDENPDQPSSDVISEETGRLDARFTLWRRFCAENNIPIDTLPSELSEEDQEKWTKLKEDELLNSDDE